jgi:hypothetical protein
VFGQKRFIGGNDIFTRLEYFELDLFCRIGSTDQFNTYLDSVVIQQPVQVIGQYAGQFDRSRGLCIGIDDAGKLEAQAGFSGYGIGLLGQQPGDSATDGTEADKPDFYSSFSHKDTFESQNLNTSKTVNLIESDLQGQVKTVKSNYISIQNI